MHLKFHGTIKNILPLHTPDFLYHCTKGGDNKVPWLQQDGNIPGGDITDLYYYFSHRKTSLTCPEVKDSDVVLTGKYKPGQKVSAKAALQDKILGILQGRQLKTRIFHHEKLKDKTSCIKTVNLLLDPTHRQNSIFPALSSTPSSLNNNLLFSLLFFSFFDFSHRISNLQSFSNVTFKNPV